MTIGDRLTAAFKETFGTEDKDFIAEKLGYKNAGSVYKVISGERELDFEKLLAFRNSTKRTIDWLLTGDGPKSVKRIDFKNLWSRIVKAWEIAVAEDRSLRIELEQAQEMSQRNFMPDLKFVERVSSITPTPLLWLLTGEGPSRGEKPFENAPAYLADLVVDYKLKEALPLPLKKKLMSTDLETVQLEQSVDQKQIDTFDIPFSAAEVNALNKLASENSITLEEKIRQIVAGHLIAQGLVIIRDIANSKEETETEEPKGLQMLTQVAVTESTRKKRA